MDGTFGELLFYIIGYSFLLFSIIGIVRLLKLQNDAKKHYLTKIMTFIFIAITFFLFIGSSIGHKNEMEELAGDYIIEYYKCEKCFNCIVKLKINGTYELTKSKQIIDTGDWDFTKTFVTPFIIFNNGNEQQINSNRTLSYIKNNNCQEYWRNQNLAQEINGKIIKIDSTKTKYGFYSIEVEKNNTKETIKYTPKYIHHPWLNNKIRIDYLIRKEKNSMTFIIKKTNGDTLILNERIRLKESIDEIINKH